MKKTIQLYLYNKLCFEALNAGRKSHFHMFNQSPLTWWMDRWMESLICRPCNQAQLVRYS